MDDVILSPALRGLAAQLTESTFHELSFFAGFNIMPLFLRRLFPGGKGTRKDKNRAFGVGPTGEVVDFKLFGDASRELIMKGIKIFGINADEAEEQQRDDAMGVFEGGGAEDTESEMKSGATDIITKFLEYVATGLLFVGYLGNTHIIMLM